MDKQCKSSGCDNVASKGYELCHSCIRERESPDVCNYLSYKERSVLVPWCGLRDCELLSIDGSWYCDKCKKKEVKD